MSLLSSRTRRAFTLMELLATLVVAAIVSSVAVAGFSGLLSRSNEEVARAHVEEIYRAQLAFAGLRDEFNSDPGYFTSPSLVVTLLPSSSPSEVSMSVGSKGSLALMAAFDGGCLGLLAPAPGVNDAVRRSELSQGVLCDARSLLPPGEFPLLSPGIDGG